MLIGQYKHTIDVKKRLALPVKFRGELGVKVVITKGVENCLVIYTEKEWEIISQKLANLPMSQVEARSFTRHLLASAIEVELDKLGERTVWIDCDVIQGDGGTRTASITGSFIALIDSLLTLKKRGILKDIPVKDYVAAISVGIVEGRLCLDLNYEEDSKAEVDMNIIMTGKGNLVEIQGTAEKRPFSKKDLDHMMLVAKSGIEGIVAIQRKILKLEL